MSAVVELIPDPDAIHRLVDFPNMYEESKGLIWDLIFQFPTPAFSDSVIWSKYAATTEAIHALGLEREALKRQTKPEMRYAGFISATAEKVRKIQTKAGHGFRVLHEPAEGLHHGEISYQVAVGAYLNRAEKNELKFALRAVFGPLIAYAGS